LQRYFLHLAYDGTNYCGWQVQPKVNTVQQTIENALRLFVPDLKCIIGCGRTDTGVHAKDYYAHFDTKVEIHPEIVYKLNAVLPIDISIKDCFTAKEHLHARFSATDRSYEYFVHFSKDPFKNRFSVFHSKILNIDLIGEIIFSDNFTFYRNQLKLSNWFFRLNIHNSRTWIRVNLHSFDGN